MLNIEPEMGTFRIRARLVREGPEARRERVVRPAAPAFNRLASRTPRGAGERLRGAPPSPRGELRAAWR